MLEKTGSPPPPEAVLPPVRLVRILCREPGATFVAGVVLVPGVRAEPGFRELLLPRPRLPPPPLLPLLSTHELQFYGYTNKKPPNPGFSQVKVLFLTCLMFYC
ncbi:hypothetical protein GUJ93_ZPchr0002g24895 [Zizania palustris]|uniref:Uncharacterized protein n=1 Tax=Zizania palustris TaxID=103762 RepID=A0A8J5V3G0_ZIZPA|nr:hypothetical protein GUJ93_ZPchr0002g24895 [Zizania palustris]KAG8056807.1 hypothetical protein GUJ93_ZPchr0002g24895 [Zizania palustris]